MNIEHIGIALSFVAMLAWGMGDFFIQKSIRKLGDWEALFFVTLFGAILLAPFSYRNALSVLTVSGQPLLVMAVLCAVLFLAAILDFEALRVGKLSIVEPIWSFEVPVSAFLAFFILSERISVFQISLIVALLAGLAFVSIQGMHQLKKSIFERGAFIAFIGAILMGGANFFMGWSSRLSDPITANFITDLFVAVCSFAILLAQGKVSGLYSHLKNNKKIILFMSIPDKIAWVAFAFAMSLAPIGVVVALSESYIIIAVILGLAINREKLRTHQKWGLLAAVFSAILLAAITG